MEHLDLVIIGAGWHGLAMAKTFLEIDCSKTVAILDYAESLGGTWAHERLYPGLKTNNMVGSYEFSDYPLSPEVYGLSAGQHIPGQVVHRYLCDFCENFGLTTLIRLRTKVRSLEMLENGEWLIRYLCKPSSSIPAKEGVCNLEQSAMIASKIVLATGTTSEPAMPLFSQQKTFKGALFHAKDFRTRANDLEGAKNVLVIGGNKSAWDVAYSACTRFGAIAHVALRSSGGGPSWCWPSRMDGFIRSISEASATRLFTWLDPNPYGSTALKLRNLIQKTWIGRQVTTIFWQHLDEKLIRLNEYDNSPGTVNLKPWTSSFWMGNSLSIHNYESNWFDLARTEQIQIHVSHIASLSEKGAHLADGTFIETGVIVCCTGWKSAPDIAILPLHASNALWHPNGDRENQDLAAEARVEVQRTCPALTEGPARIIPGLLASEQELPLKAYDSTDSRNTAGPLRLYRFMLPCDDRLLEMRNIAVIGALNTIHTVIVAQAQALWISAFFNGHIIDTANPHRIRQETFYHTEYQKIRRPREAGGSGSRHPDLVFDSIPYIDLLLEDLHMKKYRKKTWWKEILEAYRLPDYKGLAQEWLASQKK